MANPIHVLHVDDEPDFADVAATFLEREEDRFEVKTVTSASEGLDLIADSDFDCVVSDYDIRGQNGIDFLEAVRNQFPELPFILFTGKGSEEVASDAISAGATDYLQKGSGTDQYELLANRVRNTVEQYRTKREAQISQQRLQELADTTTDCLWMFDRDWEELLFISGYEDIWGRPTEAIEENPQDFLNGVDPDHRDFVKEAMNQLSAGESIDIEYKIRGSDGKPGWVWVKGEPVFDDDGNVVRVVGFTREITERKKHDQELELEKRRFEAIFENSNDAIFLLDVENDAIIDANPQATDLLGYSREELLSSVGSSDVHSDHLEEFRAFVDTVNGTGHGWTDEFRCKTKNGDWVETEISMAAIELDGSSSLLANVRDISERKERERERVAMIEFLQSLYDVATDGALTTDEKITRLLELGPEQLDLPYGHLTRIETPGDGDEDGTQTVIEASGDHDLLQAGDSCPLSQSYCRRTIEHDELLEIQDALAAGWADDPAYDTFDLGCYIGTAITVNNELYGTVFFASDAPRADRFTDAERTFVRLMSQLVSYELERKQVRSELQQQNDRLEEFASVVSHDLRNPLQVAKGRLELATEECDSGHLDDVAHAYGRTD